MPTEGLIFYYDLEQFCAENDFQGRMRMLGATQGLRLQLLATHRADLGAVEITTAIVLTFRDLAAQIHIARIELETAEIWDASAKLREAQMDRAEQAFAVLRAHLQQRLPLITRFCGGMHIMPGMQREIQSLHTTHGLFTIERLRSSDPHSPRRLKRLTPPIPGELTPAQVLQLVERYRQGETVPQPIVPQMADLDFWYLPRMGDPAEGLLDLARATLAAEGGTAGDYVALKAPLPVMTILDRAAIPVSTPARKALATWLQLHYDVTV